MIILCIHPVLEAVVSQTSYEVEEEVGSVTVCVNISGAALAREVTVTVSTEDTETFRFFIDPNQEDDAILVIQPDSAIVTILDEEEGMIE